MTSTADILAAREQTHGAFRRTAAIAQQLKSVIHDSISGRDPGEIELNAVQAEAIDLISTKIARILSGNPDDPEHWRDIAGYAELVARDLSGHDAIHRIRVAP